MPNRSLTPVVALVGSPNAGKTTLFNWLTGSKFKTVNYPGSTVESHMGKAMEQYGVAASILDTPGIYSLQPHSEDEWITLRVMKGETFGTISAAIVVVDGTQMNRQLYLVRQIQALGIPIVIAVTMMDVVKRSRRVVDLEMLSRLAEAPVIGINGRLGGGVADLIAKAAEIAVTVPMPIKDLNWDEKHIQKELHLIESWARAVVDRGPDQTSLEKWRHWDRVLLHPIWGVFSFVLIMGFLFSSIFWMAAPMMNLVDAVFELLARGSLQLIGDNLVGHFLADGIVTGFGSVMVFVPQIFILFFGLSLLEDSGYLARAATIVDRPLQKIGLSGRTFVPLLSGFACAVPGILATRNIRSPRERWITVFILPFMTCSARLPVYTLLLAFIFNGKNPIWPGLAMVTLYVGSAVIGAIAATTLNRIVKKDQGSHFIMELPIYRWPKISITFRTAFHRTSNYVKKAGPTILAFVILLWLGTHLPFHSDDDKTTQLKNSVVGHVGRMIEPVFEPMGADWRVGVGIMSAFVAREVFVSSLAVIFNLVDSESDSIQQLLLKQMQQAHWPDGRPLFTAASVTALIVFFMIALQCLSTTSVTWREMNSRRYALVQLFTLNFAAYIMAVIVYQGLMHLGL